MSSLRLSRSYSFLLIMLFAGPIIFSSGFSFFETTSEDSETWSFLLAELLTPLTFNTIILAIFTTVLSLMIGMSQALLINSTNIPYKKLLHYLFFFPLCYPIYVLSFVYVGAFEYSSPLATYLRENLAFELFSIKGSLGVAFVFSLALSPYAYLYLSTGLRSIGKNVIFSAYSLGMGRVEILKKIIFPQLKPWFFACSVLITLEVFCDFGGVSVFNYETFSTAIYHAWSSLFSVNSAIKLSLIPTLFAILLFTLSRGKTDQKKMNRSESRFVLFEFKKIGHLVSTLFILGYAFLVLIFPLSQLINWSLRTKESWQDVIITFLQTGGLALVATICIVLSGLAVLYTLRFTQSSSDKKMIPLLNFGYALPGSIIAISLMAVFSSLNVNFYGPIALIVLFIGYGLKFFSVSFQLQRNQYHKISKRLDWSAQTLGLSPQKLFKTLHLRILTPAILSSAVFLFIEIIKEMPITLILRPFGMNTLATKVYEFTSEGEWERASLYSIILLFFGLIAIILGRAGRKF